MKANPPMRILHIDDEEDARELIATTFSLAGYEVTSAATIETGMEIAKLNRFDLYIVDSHYPDGLGPQLCSRLHILNKKIPIVVYTGSDLDSDRKAVMDAGATIYLVKPHDIDELETIVANLTKCLRNE